MLTRRAIFGGTFDPVHFGHLAAADEVREALRIEDFRFLPAGVPPHRDGTHADAAERLVMLELALAGEPGFSIDDRELRRPGPSFMVDTLASLRAEFPQDALMLVVGQDALNGLDRWHEWQRLPALAHLVVLTRPGEAPNYGDALGRRLEPALTHDADALSRQPAGLVLPVAVTPRPISSTAVRAAAGDPQTLRQLVPQAVAEHIEGKGLYGPPDL